VPVIFSSLEVKVLYPLELALASKVRLELGEHPSMSRNALPAAVEVSIGCSVALRVAPRPSSRGAFGHNC
jgi:hypothetical protein